MGNAHFADEKKPPKGGLVLVVRKSLHRYGEPLNDA